MTNFLPDIETALRAYANQPLAVDLSASGGARVHTYGQVHQRASNLAAVLKQRVLASPANPPVIGIIARNSSDWLVAELACLFAGYTALPLPLALSRQHAGPWVAQCQAFVLDSAGARALAHWACEPARARAIAVDQPMAQAPLWSATAQPGDWLCKIALTAGTGGQPKGVQLAASALGAMLASLRQATGPGTYRNCLSMLPLSLLLEQVTALYLPLLEGGRTCFLPASEPLLGEPNASPDRLVAWLLQVRPTAMAVPGLMIKGFKTILAGNGVRASALAHYLKGGVHITCTGSTVAANTLQWLADAGVAVFQAYGLSENASLVSLNTAAQHRIGSVGCPLPHVRVRIGAGGAIEVSSDSLFSGYFGPAPGACALTADGWLVTGDLGALDADGFLYIQGRRKHQIHLPARRPISPEPIEREYRQWPRVRDAVVFAHTDGALAALVVSTAPLNLRELERWAIATFAPASRPARLWQLDHNDPALGALYTSAGRPRREAIAQAYATWVAEPSPLCY